MFFPNWRSILTATIGLKFLFALANSYIHPDEHFQSLEPLASWIFGYATNQAWEFILDPPARSMVPLLAVYYPIMRLSLCLQLSPIQTWYMVRLVLMLGSWMAIEWFLHQMLRTKQERVKAIFFILTSYSMLVYQSHTFSNSVETVLVVAMVYMINELRLLQTVPSEQYRTLHIVTYGLGIGAISAFGVFNRITFPAFAIVPGFFLIPAIRKWKLLCPSLLGSFGTIAAICVVIDTAIYRKVSVRELWANLYYHQFSFYVIAPLTNFLYNSKTENLSAHGIHPFGTHLMAGLPQLLGPGLIFLFGKGKNMYWKTTPFLSAVSAVAFLSMIPHQEVRFLMPTVPLFCCCFDLTVFDKYKNAAFLTRTVINLWLVFNAVLAVFMGIFHQGGVVPAMDYFYKLPTQPDAIIWWRTYLAPSWMLGAEQNSTQFVQLDTQMAPFLAEHTEKQFIDARGMPHEKLQPLLKRSSPKLMYLVTPIASFNKFFNHSEYELVWKYNYHLGLDHLDFLNMRTLMPGLGIYKLL